MARSFFNSFQDEVGTLYSIGEVVKMCHISHRTLRHYEDLGLITPDAVKPNGYRYYRRETILRIPIIKYLKMMNFSLKQTKVLLDQTSYDNVLQNFDARLSECKGEMLELQERQSIILDWEDLIKEANAVLGSRVNTISVKYFDEEKFIGMPFSFDNDYAEATINIQFTEYIEEKKNKITGPVMMYVPDWETKISKAKEREAVDVFIFQKALRPLSSDISFVRPGGLYACAYHIGPFEQLPITYRRMDRWAKQSGYKLGSSSCERFVVDYWTTRDANKFVTEILVPLINGQGDRSDEGYAEMEIDEGER